MTETIHYFGGRALRDMSREELERAVMLVSSVRTPLFQHFPDSYPLRSGGRSTFKVECDALTPADWDGLATMAIERGLLYGPFEVAIGVPRGGVPFAEALMRRTEFVEEGAGRVVCEDVWTTGNSIQKLLTRSDDRGLVAFARGPITDSRVRAIWTLG